MSVPSVAAAHSTFHYPLHSLHWQCMHGAHLGNKHSMAAFVYKKPEVRATTTFPSCNCRPTCATKLSVCVVYSSASCTLLLALARSHTHHATVDSISTTRSACLPLDCLILISLKICSRAGTCMHSSLYSGVLSTLALYTMTVSLQSADDLGRASSHKQVTTPSNMHDCFMTCGKGQQLQRGGCFSGCGACARGCHGGRYEI